MKSNPRIGVLAPIIIGLLGMGAYQIIVHLKHPAIIETDLFHGLWIGLCLGWEITGLYQLFNNKRGPAA